MGEMTFEQYDPKKTTRSINISLCITENTLGKTNPGEKTSKKYYLQRTNFREDLFSRNRLDTVLNKSQMDLK